mmetsp:Transcript_3115/g.7489  ORF Transcript_3115/g.7489 Transcript_3115/m.7489 type:complete len:509 (+) Transcript_3115:291-1817(+)|eukprot:CAMPEP_0182927008 /NCGR_PEP_ID=MMETSP0105_2-20130417/12932_1 /TAXON_ID=81532 ORGANISM="Acanthoeca-like sp., Strain 10tr" /NCGR_SAMPLE_ID=MMETSP0105_2 /ASSEMBLY_ACC=CAM_ASM_000205 /LENGTH=508 /DNA_ID=CAMNT_0025064933 /DNA_START=281 /DNA_END=1807 /DNA_ORIENTATION=+
MWARVITKIAVCVALLAVPAAVAVVDFGNDTSAPPHVILQSRVPSESSSQAATPLHESISHAVPGIAYAAARATCVAVSAVVAVVVMAAMSLWASVGTHTMTALLHTTLVWWRGLAHYWWHQGTYANFPIEAVPLQTKVYIRSIALAMTLWSLPHYRNGSFQEDMEKNLRNVAIPGTGLPLSVFCRSKLRFYLATLVLAPLACTYIAVCCPQSKSKKVHDVSERFAELLLKPNDWFTLWRINCCLASYHAHVTGSTDYLVEDKWSFLKMAEEKGVPVSPTLDLPAIVCKDRNEEGGMGIAFYANARHGGNWIIQKVLKNAPFVAGLLPEEAPLSTIRIVTASTAGIPTEAGAEPGTEVQIEPLSCVVRLGRAGALTDHDAVLFDTDLATGVIRPGTINKQWYRLGLEHTTFTAPPVPDSFTSHPDSGVAVTGKTIPGIDEIRDIVTTAHRKCCPEVPLCGWDVALSDAGTVLLEVNLSCNFFQATIDHDKYYRFVDRYFRDLEGMQSK